VETKRKEHSKNLLKHSPLSKKIRMEIGKYGHVKNVKKILMLRCIKDGENP